MRTAIGHVIKYRGELVTACLGCSLSYESNAVIDDSIHYGTPKFPYPECHLCGEVIRP